MTFTVVAAPHHHYPSIYDAHCTCKICSLLLDYPVDCAKHALKVAIPYKIWMCGIIRAREEYSMLYRLMRPTLYFMKLGCLNMG